MMRLIVASSLRFRYLVLAFGAALTYFGVTRLDHIPIDVFSTTYDQNSFVAISCLYMLG